MVDLECKPFVSQIDGHDMLLSQNGCTIMMENSVMKAITESLFAGKEKRKGPSQDVNQQNKRQNCGNPTVRTECGATAIIALQQTTLRNNRLNQQALKQAKSRLDRESKNISTTLTLLAALKRKKPDAYWIFNLSSSQQELTMILRLLSPDCGVISKGKQEQWRYIEDHLAGMLSQAAVDARAEEYMRRLAAIAAELAALDEQELTLENSTDPVENTGNNNPSENDQDQPAGLPDLTPAGE